MLRPISITIALLLMLTATPSALAETRVALVIGNGAYDHVTDLANPARDARLMADTLTALGFEVISAIDAGQKDIKRAVKRFGGTLRNSGKDAIGLFYYAGHGVQVGGVNYLIPVDANIEHEGDVDIEAVSAGSILSQMEYSGARLNFVILDACRNNPFRGFGRSADRGLARMDAPAGSLIAYATSPGDVAADGTGRNSPYTAALARMLRRPGLTVEAMFRNVRNAVREKTGTEQTPWESSSLTGEAFYFAGRDGVASDPAAATVQAADADTVFWRSVQSSDNPAAFEAYLSAYPAGKFVSLARVKLDELTQVEVATVDPAPEIADLAEDRWVDATGSVNVREGPGTSFGKAGRAAGGSKLRVTGKVLGTDWYRVALANGMTGYVHGDLLTTVDPAREAEAPETKPVQTGPAAGGTQVAVGTYPALEYAPGVTFRDCPVCPEMIVVPGGRFEMGSNDGDADEKPVHPVTISEGLAVGVYEVTVGEFRSFVDATGHDAENKCTVDEGGGEWVNSTIHGWHNPGFTQSERHPVTCVSWYEAQAYVAWLGRETGKPYRLLSEAEWEYVARGGTSTRYWWGDWASRDHANYGNEKCCDGFASGKDRWIHTSPVGSFRPNGFGLHDVHGNVEEWVEDCWNDSYQGAPVDGSAWTTGECYLRVMRLGSWVSTPSSLHASGRNSSGGSSRISTNGFRVARTIVKL